MTAHSSYVSFLDRPLAITDLETTGTDQLVHEIIEIGVVLVDQRTLAVLDEWEAKIAPAHIKTAQPRALEVNGYRPEDWTGAITLAEAMGEYARRTAGAVLASHNVTFEWRFLDAAFMQTGIEDPMDYHRVCLFSIAWDRLRASGMRRYNLEALSEHFGLVPEPMPHRALNGARAALEVYRKLRAA